MALRDWIMGSRRIATANVANIATVGTPSEKMEYKPGQTERQPGQVHPYKLGVRMDSSFVPVVCKNCARMEEVEITCGTGKFVPGCLYTADGSYLDGWKRIPDGLKECMWDSMSSSGEYQKAALNTNRSPTGKR